MDQSFNDLKFQLQQELQKEGMVENMKTQLRYKLLDRLQMQQKKIPTTDKISESELLLKRVMASAVADYLRDTKQEYSLSVFVPESSFGNSLLSQDELKLLLKQDQIKQGSVLQNIIADILLIRPREPYKSNAATQTYTGDAIINLEQKLSLVDDMYKTKIEQELLKPQMDFEERLFKLRREYDQRFKAELSAEITRLREFELQNIRLEEADKTRRKMQEYREELEKNYQEKLNKLRERERDALEKSGNKMKELESLNYNYRQKIMKEHEYIKLKEQELEKQRIQNEESLKYQKAKLDVMERELTRKLGDVGQSEDQIKKKYEVQIQAAKVQAESEFYEEREKIKNQNKQLEVDLNNMNQLKYQIQQLQKENVQLVKENQEYMEQLTDLKKAKKLVERDYEVLKDSIRGITEAQKRDQELCRKYEIDIKLKDEELKLHKTTISHKDSMIGDHKTLHQQAIQKMQQDIEQYQEKIQAQELIIKDLQQKDHKAQFSIESALFKGNIADSLLMGYNANDHKVKITQIQRELDENKLKRKEEIKRLQEGAIIPVNEQSFKYENVWDPQNSSVNFSQQFQFQKRYEDKQFIHGEDAQSQVIQSGLQVKHQIDESNDEDLL